jgi:hypothetical protein
MPDPLCHSTTVIYNGLEFRNVLTDSMDTETIYDATGVDPIGQRVRMTFMADVYPIGEQADYVHGHTWSAATNELSPGLRSAIETFLQPRQELTIKFGDAVLYSIRPGGVADCAEPDPVAPVGGNWNNYDIANGPRTTCSVLSVQGSRAARCRMTVEFTTQSKCGSDQGHVLNIRWRIHDDIDCRTWLTRRTYEGIIRFRSRMTNEDGVNPFDIARARAFPPLLRGFRREQVAYHENPNALEISFIVIDQETYAAAPSPAIHWDGTYTVTMAQAAVTSTQNLTFTLRGDPTIKKTDLLTLAMFIIDSKLQFRINRGVADKAPNFLLQSCMFQERLAENEISVSATLWSANAMDDENSTTGRFLINLSQSPDPGVALNSKFTLGQELDSWVSDQTSAPAAYKKKYDRTANTLPQQWPQEVSFLLANLQNPCCPEVLSSTAVTTSPGAAIVPAFLSNSRQYPKTYPLDKTLYSESHTKASYEYYRMSSDLISDTGWRGFPLGKQCSTSSSEATVAFAHLHCPVQIRKVTINAMRVNAWPEIPKPVHWSDTSCDPPIKHVLKEYTIEPMPVQLSADGRDSMHEVIATYWYYLDRPYQVGSAYKMPVGRLPYVSKAKLASVNAQTEVGALNADKRAMDQMFFIDPKELLATVP